MTDEFKNFWANYPKKVGKLAAEKAYQRARKRGATAAELLEGLERYKQHLPADPQFIVHPSTFLNQGRYMDQFDEPRKSPSSSSDWFDECQRLHGGACGGRSNHHTRMLIDAEKGRVISK
jgi:hypothetical protein